MTGKMVKKADSSFRLVSTAAILFVFMIFGAIAGDDTENDTQPTYNEIRYNYRLSHPLIDYRCQVEPAEAKTQFQETNNSGSIILGGLKLSAPITITYGQSGWAYNGISLALNFPYQDWRRYFKKTAQFDYELQVMEEINACIVENSNRNLSREECVEDLQKFVQKYDDIVESIQIVPPGYITTRLKNSKQSSCGYHIDILEPEKPCLGEEVEAAMASMPPFDPSVDPRYLKINSMLKSGHVCFIRPIISDEVRRLDTQFIKDLDAVISKYPNIDFSKPAGDYMNILNEIIDVFKTYQLQEKVDYLNIEQAAIILANWNRDPVEVLKEARARAEAKEGAGLVNGR